MQAKREITSTWLEALSQRCRVRFTDKRLRVRNGPVVHDVDWIEGIGGHMYPHPRCHVGTAGFNLDVYVPTDDIVTCNRCLRRGSDRNTAGHPVPAGQLALDLEVA